jgi:hypothetical protein
MAFGKTDPVEILGMTTEEFQAKLGKIDEFNTNLESIKAETKSGMDAILAKLNAPPERTEITGSGDADVDFLSDPTGTLDTRLAPLHQQSMNNTIMLQHSAARQSWPEDFTRWGTEITQKMGELSAQQQTDPRVWKAMVMMVRGEHAADIEKDGASGNFHHLEPVSAGLRPDPKNSDNLSVAEREMVKTLRPFGMTPEKYKKGKDRLVSSRAARLGRFAEVG